MEKDLMEFIAEEFGYKPDKYYSAKEKMFRASNQNKGLCYKEPL